MKLTAEVQLTPSPEQASALRDTLRLANEACNYISARSWEHHVFGQYALQRLTYYDVRGRFPLSAQIVVRCVARVADAYKLDKRVQRSFRPFSAVPYDDRIVHWYVDRREVSIWTTVGRQRIPFVCGERQARLLATRQGESDLALQRERFYLLATCNVEEPEPTDIDGFLGVDLGVTNIAVDSDGTVHAANHINNVRHRHRRLRAKLQHKGTKSAKRRLKLLSGKESRFARDTNHVISKQLVAKAQDTRRGIALEDLRGIRDRVTVRRHQRATLHSWSFFQLRNFIGYKAALIGLPVVTVDPRNTSRTCPICGHIEKRNRPTQSTFKCVACGFAGLADHIAAVNISRRAAVVQPNAAGEVA